MSVKRCLIENCDSPHVARGLCNKHWKRWRKYGGPLPLRPYVPPPPKGPTRSQRYYRKHVEEIAEKGVLYRANNAHRRAAQSKVAYAVKSGAMVRPCKCDQCGQPCKPQAHHHDYSKPFDIQWICVPCHRKEHGINFGQLRQENRV